MLRYSHIILESFLLALLTCIICTSCEKVELDDIDETTEGTTEVKILTRSTNGESAVLPLMIYAFDLNTGYLANSISIESESDSPVLSLSPGNYQVVAISFSNVCSVDSPNEIEDFLQLPEENYIDEPLKMGSATVNVTSNTTANITLYNQVCAIDLSLSDIPSDVTDVNVTLSFLYNAMTFSGNLLGNGATTVRLTRDSNGVWNAPRFYILPNKNDRLTLSISTTSPVGEQTYGYTYNGKLEANTPYAIKGSYSNGFSVNGVVNLAGWNNPQQINFHFGSTNTPNDSPSEPSEDDMQEYTVASIPTAGTIWENHFVAGVLDATATSAELILLSTTEWTDITSAFHADTPTMATDIASSYIEGEIREWSIPTREEAKLMRSTIGLDLLSKTNSVLASNSIPPLASGEQEDGNKVRYLCDEAAYTYAWDSSTTSKSGSKRTYHLRLIKRIRVKT